MTRADALAKARDAIDRALDDSARQTMTSLICRDADCDLTDAAEAMAEYNREQRERLLRLVEAALDENGPLARM